MELAGGFGLGSIAVPRRIEESFRRQIATLPATTRQALLVAAVEPVGDPVLVLRAVDRLGISVEAATCPAAACLVGFDARIQFRHPLLRSAIYQAASPEERRGAHGVLAEVTDPVTDPDRRAWAGRDRRAWAGRDRRAAANALRPFTALGPLQGDGDEFRLVPYSALVSRAQEHPNTGQQSAVTHNGMADQVTEDMEAGVLAATASGIMMQFRSLGGAMVDVAPDATAFANRTQAELVIGTVFRRSDARYLEMAWARLIPSFTGAYANFEAIPTAATTRLAFPEGTARRVREVKAKYDPESVFASWPS